MSTSEPPTLRIEPLLKGTEFPTPFVNKEYGDGVEPYTRIEQLLMKALGTLKDKPQWWIKVNDHTIKEKWRAELMEGFDSYLKEPSTYSFEGIESGEGVDDAEGRKRVAKQWSTAVLEELEALAELVISEGLQRTYVPASVDGTWLSDDAVGADTRARLLELIKPLENPTDRFTGLPIPRDYHPGSNEQVIDLVHPSLYPLVYGKSLIAPVVEGEESIDSWKKHIGTGELIEASLKKADPPKYPWMKTPEFHSNKFQWLPSEIDVKTITGKDGNRSRAARFRSYINNLHPDEHRELYRVLEEIFAAFVPLFNKVLGDLTFFNGRFSRHQADMGEGALYGECPVADDGTNENFDDEYETWYEDRQPKVPVEVRPWSDRLPPRSFDLAAGNGESASVSRLQVIVKLATIELTPEKPNYGGGAWHVEGMLNESIVASGIYYLSSENVKLGTTPTPTVGIEENASETPVGEVADSPTRLAFRTSVREPSYEQNDDKGVAAVYGLANDETLVQSLGSVATIEGRCLAWPNTLQHQVQPFTLADKARAGYRKILVFFLIDPSKRIVSTSDIPPQQEEWFLKELLAKKRAREVAETSDERDETEAPHQLLGNRDVLGEVLKFAWHFPHSDALAVREELMAERKVFVNETMKESYEREFSLCEH